MIGALVAVKEIQDQIAILQHDYYVLEDRAEATRHELADLRKILALQAKLIGKKQ